MKLTIVKLGARIVPNSKSTSGGEAESIIKILLDQNCEVDAYTKVLLKDEKPIGYNIFDLEQNTETIKDKDYEALIVINGNSNYFGGKDDPSQTLIYKIINNFEGKVFYILCDPALTLKQVWKSIEKKEWSKNYKKEDIHITRTDIKYITQVFNLDELKNQLDKLDIPIQRENIIHFDFQKFPLFTMKQENVIFEETEFDLLYGGTFRNAQREDDMIKYYWGLPEDIKVEMFGKIDASNFKEDKIKGLNPPSFGKTIPYNLFNEKMKKSKTSIIIGDKLYKKMDDIAQRVYEGIRVGNLIFLDKSYDFNKRTFSSEFLRDFCYIDSKQEAITKLRKIKESRLFFEDVVHQQRENIIFDKKEYSNYIISILKYNGKRIKI
jgi:hypothetical protein